MRDIHTLWLVIFEFIVCLLIFWGFAAPVIHEVATRWAEAGVR